MKVKTAQPAALQSCLAVRQGCLKEKGTKDVPDLKAYKMIDAFQEICKITKKWGLYISCSNEVDSAEIIKAAPYLSFDQSIDLMFDGMFFLFDTEAEMNRYYKLTVGEDGATELNKYDGNARIYALTCSNEGKLWNENT